MIKVVLVDDEPNNTQYVKELLEINFPQLQVVAVCNDTSEAIMAIYRHQPQLVFMDVEMPGLNGFEVLKKLEPLHFETIFITAYNHYAIEAFEVHAAGYLTKPLVIEKFIKATNIAIQKIEKENINQYLFSMLQGNNNSQSQQHNKMALPTQSGLLFIHPAEILYCRSSGNYTQFFTKDGKSILVSRQLGEFEKLLPSEDFHRIHDQCIVRLQYIRQYIRGRGGELVMENNETLPVSASRKDGFLLRFEKWMRK